jgi:hypothetical protein
MSHEAHKLIWQLIFIVRYPRNRDSSVGIATGYRLDGRSSIPGRDKIFSSPQRPDRLWGPPSLLFNGYRGSFPGVKQPGPEADHSPPSSTEVKNCGAVSPLPHMSSWYGAKLIKRRDNFTFLTYYLLGCPGHYTALK